MANRTETGKDGVLIVEGRDDLTSTELDLTFDSHRPLDLGA